MISEAEQEQLFEKFWRIANYDKQNYLLAGLMTKNFDKKNKRKNFPNGNIKLRSKLKQKKFAEIFY